MGLFGKSSDGDKESAKGSKAGDAGGGDDGGSAAGGDADEGAKVGNMAEGDYMVHVLV